MMAATALAFIAAVAFGLFTALAIAGHLLIERNTTRALRKRGVG